MGREVGEKGEGSGGKGGGKWGERGRELGMGYPPVHPLKIRPEDHLLASCCLPSDMTNGDREGDFSIPSSHSYNSSFSRTP